MSEKEPQGQYVKDGSANAGKSPSFKFAGILAAIGLAVTFAPVFIAWASANGGNMWDESGAGAVIWLMFASVPMGGFLLLAALVVAVIQAIRSLKS